MERASRAFERPSAEPEEAHRKIAEPSVQSFFEAILTRVPFDLNIAPNGDLVADPSPKPPAAEPPAAEEKA